MASVTYVLFPDGRDNDLGVSAVNREMRARNNGPAQYHSPFRPVDFGAKARSWYSVGSGIQPDGMLALLKAVDWPFPAMLVYRTGDEDRWSFVTLGLSSSELGEVDG
jgi:hypothetical protein